MSFQVDPEPEYDDELPASKFITRPLETIAAFAAGAIMASNPVAKRSAQRSELVSRRTFTGQLWRSK